MTPPPPVGTATARKVNTAAQPRRESAPPRRAPLRVVPSQQQPSRRRDRRAGPLRRLRASGHLLTMISVAMVVGALLVVVIGQALLADGQVRLQSAQSSLSKAETIHGQDEYSNSQLETPARIVSDATGSLGMVVPSQVAELPYVSLNTPLPTPKVTPAPVAPTTATTTPANTGTTSSTNSTATTQ